MTEPTSDEVARMRLLAQRVAGPGEADAVAVVRHLTCVQAQDLRAATLAVAMRAEGGRVSAVRAALDAGTIVRSWPMRRTLHLVLAEDLPWMLSLTSERMIASMRAADAQLGLTEAVLQRAADVLRAAVADRRESAPVGLSRSEALAAWEGSGLSVEGQRGYGMLARLAVRGVICQGPTDGTQQRFVFTQEWITAPRQLTREAALLEWARRYFVGHGPATLPDFARWTGLTVTAVRSVLKALRESLASVTIGGVEHLMDPQLPDRHAEHRRSASAPHLLPAFDELILGYADRTVTVAAAHADRIVPGANGVFKPVVTAGGRAVGTWRRPAKAVMGTAGVQVQPFDALPRAVDRALPRLTRELTRRESG